jgi:hypothetical protein
MLLLAAARAAGCRHVPSVLGAGCALCYPGATAPCPIVSCFMPTPVTTHNTTQPEHNFGSRSLKSQAAGRKSSELVARLASERSKEQETTNKVRQSCQSCSYVTSSLLFLEPAVSPASHFHSAIVPVASRHNTSLMCV